MTPLCGHRESGLFWFRIYGFGLHGKRFQGHDAGAVHPLLFSERNGLSKILKIAEDLRQDEFPEEL